MSEKESRKHETAEGNEERVIWGSDDYTHYEDSEQTGQPDERTLDEKTADPGLQEADKGEFIKEIAELKDKYLRCYAEFENYKKRTNKDKEELVKYGNESLIYELLPSIDSLELALKHVSEESPSGLTQGVEMTLKELLRTLEKFGLTRIVSLGAKFDPAIHHAMMRTERDDIEEKMVVEELRAGYLYNNKVIRPSLVTVSIKPGSTDSDQRNGEDSEDMAQTEPENDFEIQINKDIEEE
jgi:molecular chaperone GrpE